MLRKAQEFGDKGDPAREIQELRKALDNQSARPYALGMLGVALLRTGQVPEAVTVLERAVQILPGDATNHSNLGYAHFILGHVQQAERAVARALEIDRDRPQARYMMGLILLARGDRDNEALAHLKFAQRKVATAHIALAGYYRAAGQEEAATRELDEYSRTKNPVPPDEVERMMKALERDRPVPAGAN
jgi:Flp pilus assembly protein TadD